MSTLGLEGWERLRHGGLLLDAQRQREVAAHEPEPISSFHERDLRKQASAILNGDGDVPGFVAFVLRQVCGFSGFEGNWLRGNQVPAEWGRVVITGETVKPRQLWRGPNGAVMPVFLNREKRIGIGRGRRVTSQVLQWLRAGDERLALVTNGNQWRLVFAGLDFDAWCEWDLDLWFDEGELSPQVAVLRTMLAPTLWTPAEKNVPAPLLQAILDSRKGQADLSQVLGERVREAVEVLVQGHGEALKEHCADVDPAAIYRAAVRMVMRLVVVLFAESRELLPRDNALYHGSYGITGLLEELEKIAARGGGRLFRSYSAWPRVLALFRLVHDGSHHPSLPVPAYGGELFSLGEQDSSDGLSRALAVFESACFDQEVLPDRDVHSMLERITRTRVKLRHGRASTWVPSPVDFSDLSSEYIGILYEGLLDYELKIAPVDDPVVFLAVGNQPALPLSRLEKMDDTALKNLLETMKDTSSKDDEAADEQNNADEGNDDPEVTKEEDGEDSAPDDGASDQIADTEPEACVDDDRHATRIRAEAWGRRAVEVCKLARKPRGNLTPEQKLAFEVVVGRKAHQLIAHMVLPGEWYLVGWGGTRKGSGTFYTRPGLAVPTVQRTLRPLAWDPPPTDDGTPDFDAPLTQWTPKKPEEILALKILDPACGSGTFPVAALRFLTDALYASLHHHGRISEDGDRSVVALLTGSSEQDVPEERLCEELLPCRPDDALFEPRLKAVLRRHVVERCIYGVDLDPLAVELCRLALWIETMDRSLPFSFLDHKIKCGNGLVGAWFDQFQHYPAMAWKNREGGDKSHSNGVHFEKGVRTKAIKVFVKEQLQPDLADSIVGQLHLGEKILENPARIHDEALAVLSKIHDLPVQDSAERARIYRDELLNSETYRSLKQAMDLWCACWFWPARNIDCAPLPTTFAELPEVAREVVVRLSVQKRFFHWELEFPDVFRTTGSGFDAVLGNPPWDIAKPNSKEFFSNIDPLYRAYGKQEALRYQTAYFNDEAVERNWLDYNADFRAQSNFMKYAANAFGDPDYADKSQDQFTISRGKANAEIHARWRITRAKSRGFSDPTHSFCHQGSADINLYKLFLEQAHALLCEGGRMGFIVPSGLYSDHGTGALRELFLDHCIWEWIFGFENRDKIFDIDSRFKFNPIIIEKGGETTAIKTAFMRRKLEDWERAESFVTLYDRARVEQFSPKSKTILEIQSARDLEILEKIYENSVLLGDDGPDGWGITYATEFHMTNDSKLFPPLPKWEEWGYRPDEYSRWLKGDWRPIDELWTNLGVKPLAEGERRCAQPPYDRLPIPRADIPEGIILSREADEWIREDNIPAVTFTDANGRPLIINLKDENGNKIGRTVLGPAVALPLLEGRMIGQFDFSAKGWVSGKGRTAEWRDVPWDHKQIEPQYLMGSATSRFSVEPGMKLPIMNIGSATNRRTVFGAVSCDAPCNHSLNPMRVRNTHYLLALCAALNSFTLDAQVRMRLTGLNISFFILDETAVIRPALGSHLVSLSSSMSMLAVQFSPQWLTGKGMRPKGGWRDTWMLTPHERLRGRALLDALVAAFQGLNMNDLFFILKCCDYPSEYYKNKSEMRRLDPKGFWRVDRDKDPELRHTVLTLVAFHNLLGNIADYGGNREKGIEAFCAQNDGDGWMLPETLCLADYGLGHDERAKKHQPVASRLGPRFYDWQLEQDADESWRECHLHARNLLGETGYQQLLEDIKAEKSGEQIEATDDSSDLSLNNLGLPLFDRG